MTATATELIPATDTWTKQLEQLRARYKHVRPAIVAALNVLLHDENVSVDDAKSRAAARGFRITAASLAAAQRLLSRMDTPPAATAKAGAATPPTPASAPTRAPRRGRAAEPGIDAETLIRGVVAKIQASGNLEAERLREVVRKAIAMLQTAVG